MNHCLSILLMFITLLQVHAQEKYQFETGIPKVMFRDGQELSMPFAGGINAAQIQEIDLDGDGVEELVIWDINAGMIRAFRKTNGEYVPIPEAPFYFPDDVNAFMILKDFDGDGRKDLFTGSPFGIKAYKNLAGADIPRWEVAQDFLRLDNGANLTSNILDIPLIEDLDGDGDLDVLTWNFASGDYLEFYQNTSMERKNQTDIDGFAPALSRWGNFEFCGCGNISFGITCNGQPISTSQSTNEQLRTKHSGGHTLLYRDFNEDGTKDLLIGQDLCNTLYYLPNQGTDLVPSFDNFSTTLPGYGPLPEFPIFLAAFPLEENLVISSHSSEVASNFGIDFAQSLYLLPPNQGGVPETKAFLQENMLDFGENSRPFFKGNQFGGSLFVAANITSQKESKSKIFEFQLENEQLQLVNEDFLDLEAAGLRELSYQEYMSASNRAFHVITGEQVSNNIPEKIIWISPVSSPLDQTNISIPSFNLRGLDQIFLFHDGTTDFLLLARQTGELILFSIDLSAGPILELLERDFLGFADNPVNRNLSVAASSGEQVSLMAIDQRGVIFLVKDVLGEPVMSRVSIQTSVGDFDQTRFGRNTWITFVPGLVEDGPDLIIGNRAGGLEYLNRISGDEGGPDENLNAIIFPNPSKGEDLKVIVNQEEVTLNIYGASGKQIREGLTLRQQEITEISLFGFAPGLYLLEMIGKNRERQYKKIWVSP